MKLAVMQPYLFPYIGYFQLVAAVDRFVFYDDVAYANNSWINRNRWRLQGQTAYFTVPLNGASQSKPIAEIGVEPSLVWRRKLRNTLRQAYGRAPQFDAVSALFESVIDGDFDTIAAMAKASIELASQYIGLATTFIASSACYANHHLRGSDRILDICKREAASEYLNLPSGRALYSPCEFLAHGVALNFIAPCLAAYRQSGPGFVPGLSIIDLLMHNDKVDVLPMLGAGRAAALEAQLIVARGAQFIFAGPTG
jgi:hypothetical protein